MSQAHVTICVPQRLTLLAGNRSQDQPVAGRDPYLSALTRVTVALGVSKLEAIRIVKQWQPELFAAYTRRRGVA